MTTQIIDLGFFNTSACDIYGCLAELEYYSLKKPKFPSPEENLGIGLPRTFIGVKVDANKVLDLTDEDNLVAIGISEDDLLEEWGINKL